MKNEQLVADQVRKLYDHAIFGLIATIINGCILVLVLWDQVGTPSLVVWLACVFLVSGIRLSVTLGYRKSAPSLPDHRIWMYLFFFTIFLSGLLWGAPAIFLFPPASIGHQAFLAFVTGGMVVGAVGAFTSVLTAYYLFSVPALLPLVIRFLLVGSDIHTAMAFMTLLFLLIMSLTALRTHKEYVRLLALRYENRNLVAELQQEVHQRKEAEQGLRRKNQQIEEIVATRTAELKDAIQQLRDEVQARKEAARELKENQQRMRAIINYAPLVIWAVDKEGIFTFSEGKGLEKVGFQPGELVGQSLFTCFWDNEQILSNTRQVLAGQLVSGPTFYKGIVYENRYEPIIDDNGAIIGAIGVAIDVTSQQQAREALRKSEEKYRDLVENISDILFTIDPSGRIAYISPVVESVFGYRPEEILETQFCELVDPDDRSRMKLDFDQVLDRSNRVREYRFISRSGQRRWCRTSIRPVGENHHVSGIQGILADITQSKIMEEELQRAHKMEAIGALAGGVAHDLNNILSGIVSYPDLLLLDLPRDSPLRAPLTTIKTSGEKAAAIVQDLLTLARRGVAATDTLNLNTIVEEYLQSPEFNTLLSNFSEIRITKTLQPDLFNLTGSKVHIAKSLMNLVCNAAEAMPTGGTITISTANLYADAPVIGFDTIGEGEYVLLTVADTGVGIAEEDLARIFEPFHTRKVMGRSGSGLGMAVVWGTVKDHGGHINVNSRPGVGTSVELLFPATRQAMPESSRPIPYETYLGHGELILIVDDAEQQREIATDMIRRLGYRPEAVAGGEQAIEFLATGKPALIILDMIMEPGIDGYETFRRIVATDPRQKAIIVSGYSETEQVHKTLALGAGQYLRKPYDLETIGLAIRKELEREPRTQSSVLSA